MPEISRFFGIVVQMYFNDHEPPHFHVRYGGQRALMSIDGLRIIGGSLSPRAAALVEEWARLHLAELCEDWELARQQQPLKPVAPLE